jgi:hypothetical protein
MKTIVALALLASVSSMAIDIRYFCCENDGFDLLFTLDFAPGQFLSGDDDAGEASLYLTFNGKEFFCKVDEYKEKHECMFVLAHHEDLGSLTLTMPLPNLRTATEVRDEGGYFDYKQKNEGTLMICSNDETTSHKFGCAVYDVHDRKKFCLDIANKIRMTTNGTP